MPRRAWLLALGAIAVRAAASLTVAVIDSDGVRNLRMAELMQAGRFTDALLVLSLRGQPYFDTPIVDSAAYDEWAVRIAKESFWGDRAFSRASFSAR